MVSRQRFRLIGITGELLADCVCTDVTEIEFKQIHRQGMAISVVAKDGRAVARFTMPINVLPGQSFTLSDYWQTPVPDVSKALAGLSADIGGTERKRYFK